MKEIILACSKGIATISLNRPEKNNAMNKNLVMELLETLRVLAVDETVDVVLITAEGENFCAGADITNMREMANASHSENYDDAQQIADLMLRLYEFPKPTISLIQGVALGGGMGLVAASDITIATHSANFGFPEVKIGLAASTISPYVIAAIGERAAHYYFLTGQRFSAEEALRIGLVHSLVDSAADLLSSGFKLAQSLQQNSPTAMQASKNLIRYVAKQKISVELAQKTAEHLANLRTSPEAQEGLSAFLEKRSPRWYKDEVK